MLVLSRKKNESIVIDDDITVVVVDIIGDKVKLGVEAPKEVPVHRREVFDAIHKSEEAYSEFRSELNSQNFGRAYDIFYQNRGDFGNRAEVDKMVYGLNRH